MQIADGVVNLKAEYGVDSDGDGTVAPAEWTASAPADWRRLLAIRVARAGAQPPIRAQRRSRRERGARGDANGGQSVLLRRYLEEVRDDEPRQQLRSFDDLPADPNNWRYYRYRVYERVIPLRNMLWGTPE